MVTQSEKKLPDSNHIFYTSTGFGVKSVSKNSIKKNFKILRKIAKDAKTNFEKHSK